MPWTKPGGIWICRQILTLGMVAAVAGSAAVVVVDADVAAPVQTEPYGGGRDASDQRPQMSLVASAPVKPWVREVPLEGVAAQGVGSLTREATAGDQGDGAMALAALSAPEPVTGYAIVGVTWSGGRNESKRDITLLVRTQQDGKWSTWRDVEYDYEHGPDPDSVEASRARPGTDPIPVGEVDQVQVKALTGSGQAPTDLSLAIVDPGKEVAPNVQQPAIDTAALAPTEVAADTGGEGVATSDGGITLASQAPAVTTKPMIYSRAQWGADEKMREKSSLTYGEVHAGFIHHTVNANNYRRDQVPALLRGIYAYHTQSKGWSDIGYNFIVDRFGRIWEGRFGGVDRPVVGAHTLGYNENSFAMSALGNYETAKPSSAMLDAYARLFAWKLSLHGIDASSDKQWVGSKYFKAINGHSDADQTACPGRYLYSKIPSIRTVAEQYQQPFTSRNKSVDISGSRWPDLVVRDKATKQAFVVRTAGQVDFRREHVAARRWAGMDLVAAARDLTGDGIPDMVGRNASTKVLGVYPGNVEGTIEPPVVTTSRFSGADQVTGVLDMTGDGNNDLVARIASTKRLYVYPGNGKGGFLQRRELSSDWSRYDLTAGTGDLTGDGKNDLVARDGAQLFLVPGSGRGVGGPVALPGRWGAFDIIAGLGDATNDGKSDIIARKRKSKLTYIYRGDGNAGLEHPYGPFTAFKEMNFLAASGQLTGNPRQDILGRDMRGRLVVFTNTGGRNLGRVVRTDVVFANTNLVLNVGDWNHDGHGDVMTRSASTGNMTFRAGNGRRSFAAPVLAGKGWGSVRLIAAVGDITGDGLPDLMGQPRNASMRIYPGDGKTSFRRSYVTHSSIAANGQIGAGLWNSDGSPDSILRRGDGSLIIYPGNGPGGLTGGTEVAANASRYDWIQGVGDANGDGYQDLIARERSTGILWLLPGTASGLDTRRFIADGFERFDLSG